jgi:hypothetical protein
MPRRFRQGWLKNNFPALSIWLLFIRRTSGVILNPARPETKSSGEQKTQRETNDAIHDDSKARQGFRISPKELMEAIGKISQEAVASGAMIGNGGLKPMAQGARVQLKGGKLSVVDGPFAEAKEIIGGYAEFELKSKEEAVESAVRFMELHQKYWPGWDGETEVREMYELGEFPLSK